MFNSEDIFFVSDLSSSISLLVDDLQSNSPFVRFIAVVYRKTSIDRKPHPMPIRFHQHHRVVVRIAVAVLREDVVIVAWV
jgi:hypothetical protein